MTPVLFVITLVLASPNILATPVAWQNTRQYTIYNKCPTPIDLYIGGERDSTIQINENVVKYLGIGAGFFYTDANGGSPTAEGTIRAGFLGDYYYMVADPNHANTGLQVKPTDRSPNGGFCEAVQCNGRGCPQAFLQPPLRFPPPTSSPPSPPYYRCPIADTNYDITFCPTGQFPDQGQPIHFNFQNKCLDVRGAVFADGTPVQIYDCNDSQAQRWIIKRGSTKVQVAGTNFCLDAGTHPANGIQLKIWQCHDNLPAQQWYYTDDNRIALENQITFLPVHISTTSVSIDPPNGVQPRIQYYDNLPAQQWYHTDDNPIALEIQGMCADLENGIVDNGNKVQTWTCTDNNNNQVWTL